MQSIAAVVHQVFRLLVVDFADTQQQLPRQSQGHWRLGISNDILHIGIQVRVEDLCLRELPVEIGGQPDASQWPGLGEE